MLARSVRNWPGWNAKVSRSPDGIAKAMATAPAASGLMRETVSSWKRGMAMGRSTAAQGAPCGCMGLVRLEKVERFHAVQAPVQGLAGGRAEVRGLGRVLRAAEWASRYWFLIFSYFFCSKLHDVAGCQGVWRRNTVLAQPAAALLRHPVGGPRRCELRDDARGHAVRLQHGAHIVLDLVHRGTAAVGRRDDDLDLAVLQT